jgi:hypothetical protein
MLMLLASNIMTRTTLDIDRIVLEQLRSRAAIERKSMGQVASEALAPALARESSEGVPKPFRWMTKDMGKPLIDIDDKEALGRMLDKEYLEKLER